MLFSGLVVGALLGVVMQRGRFCVTGFLRDIFLNKTWRTFIALLIVISVHAIGLTALTQTGIISPEDTTFRPLAVVIGGTIFGMGIILAGGCASGTWYRSAEGLVGSWIALVFYGLSAAAMKGGALDWLNSALRSWDTGWTTLPQATGLSPWVFTIALSLATLVAANYFLKKEASSPRPASLYSGWKRPLHVYLAAVLIGALGVIAWPLSAATGRNDGLGITSPTANLTTYVTTGEETRVDWGVMLVLGILVGAFIAAKATGEFRVRVPSAVQAVRSVAGGTMMGVGAAAAGGCTVGNGMVQTSLFSFQGWIALAFIAFGVWAGGKLWLKPTVHDAPEPQADPGAPERVAATPQVTPQTGPAITSAVGVITLDNPKTTKAKQVAPHTYYLDSMGAVCPFPLIDTKTIMKELDPGDELIIKFDCTQATEAIPRWAAEDGHTVTDFEQLDDASWTMTVKKGA